VDDHSAVRKGLASLIQSEPGLEIVATACNGEEAVELFRQIQPDVTLMDLRLPGISGVETIMTIRKEFPDARIIVLTTFDTDEDIYRALQSGAKSYLLKESPDDELWATIRAVYAGEERLPARIAALLAERNQRPNLSPRELDVLHMLLKGRSNKEIGEDLSVTEDTVKSHFRSLFAKLDVRDRTEAAISAIRHGIVHLE
jgi:two-component system NarL family response regulator